MSKITKVAVGLAVALLVQASQAASTDLTRYTAPDAVSRAILSNHVRFDDGALTPQDRPAAIHRNYPIIIEQNFARMDQAHSAAWVDQLSDVELQGIAQLYTNANADAHRAGSLLLVAANRMNGPHLARLSKFFGYSPVYNAILSAAPIKAQSFAQNAASQYEAPVAGALAPAEMARPAPLSFSTMTVLGGRPDGPITPMQFKPNVSMTLQEIYTGFRGMMIGESAATAALYETTVYAGGQLGQVFIGGYTVGTGLTMLAQTYAPDWYNGTFVNTVGNSVDWFQNTANTVGGFWGSQIYDLGHYEQQIAPTLGVPKTVQVTISQYGGDDDFESAWEDFSASSGGSCGQDRSCNKQ